MSKKVWQLWLYSFLPDKYRPGSCSSRLVIFDLRITDRLLEDIIDEILERDSITDFNKPKGSPKGVS